MTKRRPIFSKKRPPRLSRAPNRTPKLVPLRLFIILREGGPVQQNALEFFREGGPVQPNALVSERHNRKTEKNRQLDSLRYTIERF